MKLLPLMQKILSFRRKFKFYALDFHFLKFESFHLLRKFQLYDDN